MESPRYVAAIHRLDTMLDLGIRWERLEATVKNIVGITEEERASLWLYIFVQTQRARRGIAVPALAAD